MEGCLAILVVNFTCHCKIGSSVIDYCLCSDKLLSKILRMKVHDFDRSLSNHCML